MVDHALNNAMHKKDINLKNWENGIATTPAPRNAGVASPHETTFQVVGVVLRHFWGRNMIAPDKCAVNEKCSVPAPAQFSIGSIVSISLCEPKDTIKRITASVRYRFDRQLVRVDRRATVDKNYLVPRVRGLLEMACENQFA